MTVPIAVETNGNVSFIGIVKFKWYFVIHNDISDANVSNFHPLISDGYLTDEGITFFKDILRII